MSDALKPTIDFHGPASTHDYACPVLHQTHKAVFLCDKGYFAPSWDAQTLGYHIIKVETPMQRFFARMLWGIKP